ncbi:MAG: peptide deformylase [bacterium]
MQPLRILHYPDPVLQKRSQAVSGFDDRLLDLAGRMIETMYQAPGAGLAAPQVGISLQLSVIHLPTGEKEKRNPLILFNPRIIEEKGRVSEEEGCLSIPDFTAKVSRSKYVKVEYLDVDSRVAVIEGEDYLARVLQHEIDHLNGILFIDRLGRLKRDLVRKRLLKHIAPSG